MSQPVLRLLYLTGGMPGIGGRLKCEPEDFVVEEVPAYEPSGEGEHLYLWVEKRDVSHEQLLRHLAAVLNVSRNDIGSAGMKDRRAITRQYVSVPAVCESRLEDVQSDAVRILDAHRHPHKLRSGKLRGNRFDILVRDADHNAEELIEPIRKQVQQSGFPNYFGPQRFGKDNSTLEIGLELLRGEKTPRDLPPSRRRFLLRLSLSAVQAFLFNESLTRRLEDDSVCQVLCGDMMQVVASGGLFVVEDVDREQQRLELGEIAITGPMFGPKMRSPQGEPLARERSLLREYELTDECWAQFRRLCAGTRRPYVVRPTEFSVTVEREGIRFAFVLPPGSYATVLMAEFLKSDIPDVSITI